MGNFKKRNILFFMVSLIVLGIYLQVSITQTLKTKKNELTITTEYILEDEVFKIALIGDIHVNENPKSIIELKNLLEDIKSSEPDLVLFLGDYISNPRFVNNLNLHRQHIVKILGSIAPYPSVFVMGNYESWSSPEVWKNEFRVSNLDVLENETQIIETKNGAICIRGLGDSFTNRFSYVDYPNECDHLNKITITHDPEGAFHPEMRGLVFAGHTHCGQVSLPLIGAIWIPSDAPRTATCGSYQDKNITLYVTSGVGTSILPIRYGAQSQWDMITLKNNNL